MILIYAPYPHAELVSNGWMRRIAAVERIFADRERAYVFPSDPLTAWDWADYRIRTETVAPRATMTLLDFRFALHHRRLAQLVDEAELVYAHTSHSSQHLLPHYATGKIVTDLHGIAPEEEEVQGRPGSAAFHAGFEEAMVRGSAVLVTVTRAMTEHLRAKYPGAARRTITLPIVDDLGVAAPAPRPPRTRPVVVYAGGVQRWQNVDRMLQAVAACRDRCEFRFYTDRVAALRERARALGVDDAVHVSTATPDELSAKYADADYGFVLRDDVAVNRVACPTKLSEYLACGVIPIVTLAAIGDFAALGYRPVAFDDFVHGRLPDAATAAAMRRDNRAVFEAVQREFAAGERELRALRLQPAAAAAASTALLTSVERTAFLPVRNAWLEVVRGGDSHRVALDIAQPRVALDVTLPGNGAITALRLCPGDVPFVTTPIDAQLIDGSGSTRPVAWRGWRRDYHGNWCFTARGATVSARQVAGSAGSEGSRLQLSWEYVLIGIESLVTSFPMVPRRSRLLGAVREWVRAVPGARSAHAALMRWRGR